MESLLVGEVTALLNRMDVLERFSSGNGFAGNTQTGHSVAGKSFQYCSRSCTAGPQSMGCTLHCRPHG